MKFVCIEWVDLPFGEGLPRAERKALMDRYMAYIAELRSAGSQAAVSPGASGAQLALLSGRSGQITVLDGTEDPSARKISGILFVEARDLNHVVQKLAGHPALGQEGFKIIIAGLEPGWGRPGGGGRKSGFLEDAAPEER